MSITLEAANRIIAQALKMARERGLSAHYHLRARSRRTSGLGATRG